MHLAACHDTTLIPILAALGVYDNTWPGLCSDYIIEMYQDGSGQTFVRSLYLGKVSKWLLCLFLKLIHTVLYICEPLLSLIIQ